jgi:hypothetical protein
MHLRSAVVSFVVGVVIALVIIMPAKSLVTSLEEQPELKLNYMPGYRWGLGYTLENLESRRQDRVRTIELRAGEISFFEAQALTREGEVRDEEAKLKDLRDSDSALASLQEQIVDVNRENLQLARASRGKSAAELETARAEKAEDAREMVEVEAKKREYDSKLQAAKDRLFTAQESYSDRIMYGVLAGLGGALLMLVLLIKVIGPGK